MPARRCSGDRLYVALGTEADERLTESVTRAADLGIAILEVPRTDLDRITTNHLHQGIALQVPRITTRIPMICSPLHCSRHRRWWLRWTISPIPVISARSFGPLRRSAVTAC